MPAAGAGHGAAAPQVRLQIGRLSLRGFGADAGERFHLALQKAMTQGMQQGQGLTHGGNLHLNRLAIPALSAGATVEDAARQVAAGLLRALKTTDQRREEVTRA
ncbi:hypothetical protein SAMN05443244_0184 [Terriglobus roseus]|uniref:Uncharacterized protein n=2 Tax=Terriglobus roseus TaxID=392734 RepID=A0A1H4IYV2_9BACT|nr:hypothetical protein SAMN05443244_0184 [Terriglobus roseus]